MKIVHVVGARPNFMKVAPIVGAFSEYEQQSDSIAIEQLLVHTGQHYDRQMSQLFFEELGMPRPDVNLNVGSGPHGQQTGRVMEAFEQVLMEHRPDLVLVVGDVNSTLACALDAKKLGIAVAHVEAGLRSFDRTMPEEINRLATDAISDLLFTTDSIADACLRHEGIPSERIFRVGNVMIDTLLQHRDKAAARPTLESLGLKNEHRGVQPYALVTLHRPGNVDERATLSEIVDALAAISRKLPVVFPIHPRTRARLESFELADRLAEADVRLFEPLGYLDFMNLSANARVVLTDSGGVQEETTILGVPCLTIRPNTERPITISQGTNRLVANRRQDILEAVEQVLAGDWEARRVPPLWDGQAARRIVAAVIEWAQRNEPWPASGQKAAMP